MGGYDANFNPPLDDKYKCPVCLSALKDPIQTKCGHRLCSTCFKQIRGGNWYFRCPVDNTWSNHVFEDNAVKREVLSLQTHLKTCDYELVECPNKCPKQQIMRIDFNKHLEECPHRMETCKHCNIQVLVSQLAHHHVLQCPKFPVNCPVCGEAEIIRENMNSHTNIINGDCPMVIVPCCFRHIGCMHQDKRSKMPKHYIDSSTHHLMLLSTKLIDMETKHRLDIQVCKKGFEQSFNALCDKYTQLEQKYNALEAEMTENKTNLTNLNRTLQISVDSERHLNHLTSPTTSSNNIFSWSIDLNIKRKAYYSPSYCLPNTSYKVHLWLQPEVNLTLNDTYSTICVILERCDNEDELPVQFDCCFLINDPSTNITSSSSTTPTRPQQQLKAYVTTDVFQLSGHVSKPMTLFKSNDLTTFTNQTNKLLTIEFTLRALRAERQ